MSGALVVTVGLGREDFARFEELRRRHYPADRNRVPAHLTMFHALPPSSLAEVRSRLAAHARQAPPKAEVAGVMDLGGGVAFRIVSDELDRLRDSLAEDLHGLLGAQDRGGWRPHVTIQNKVANRNAQALLAELRSSFVPRPLAIAGLALHRYSSGSWDSLALYRFRG